MTKAELAKERQDAIVKILNFIQDGGDLATAKEMFQKSFDQVDVAEITQAERRLIAGGLDPAKIQYLCNVHVDLFRDQIKEEKDNPDFDQPGHPVHTFKLENLVLKSLVNDYLLPKLEKWQANHDSALLADLRQGLADLNTVHKHYLRKEVSIFPLMNKYGITAPPQVMWGVDDDIRALIKQAIELSKDLVDEEKFVQAVKEAGHEVVEMIFKEEEIMLPMLDKVANEQDWYNVKQEEGQIGYSLLKQKPMNWKPKQVQASPAVELTNMASLFINFKEGSLNIKQLSAILDMLPFALTFVDENDRVAYFGGGASIYPHSKNALGNSVFYCHTAKSRPVIERIFKEFHTGQRDKYEFWFTPKKMGRFLYLRYYAVRDEEGKYLGCLEVAQDITDIRNLPAEKRNL